MGRLSLILVVDVVETKLEVKGTPSLALPSPKAVIQMYEIAVIHEVISLAFARTHNPKFNAPDCTNFFLSQESENQGNSAAARSGLSSLPLRCLPSDVSLHLLLVPRFTRLQLSAGDQDAAPSLRSLRSHAMALFVVITLGLG